jgi:two-component system C4-dicarboxylate transport sensor histidine kinase DctB
MRFINSLVARFGWPIVLAALGMAITLASYQIAFRAFQTVEVEKSLAKFNLYQTTIENELTRLEHLPQLLASNPLVLEAVKAGERHETNVNLNGFAQNAKAEAIYIMDQSGLTYAASNADSELSFLGQNYGFRPYFQQALKGQVSNFFAIGATTRRPGYFLSAPIIINGQIRSVLAIKLDLTALNQILEATDEEILVTNADGIVVLSSNPELRYRTTQALTQSRLEEIAQERQFGAEPLDALDWQNNGGEEVQINGQMSSAFKTELNRNQWQLFVLKNETTARERALASAALVGAFIVSFATGFVFWRSQRVKRALNASQQDRRRLQREIGVRRKAEKGLEAAQKELRRTSKLAALGELSASVSHELGQPIAAMKNYIAAEEITSEAPSPILPQLSGIVSRMENITRQLKSLSPTTDDRVSGVNLDTVVDHALALLKYDLQKSNAELTRNSGGNVTVFGSAQRLEQVIINLIRNALKAMQSQPSPSIEINIKSNDDNAILTLADKGHGLQGQSFEDIIEPFYTTGPSGEGMGLGLAISNTIIQEHGGTLTGVDLPSGGALFTLTLPLEKT